MKLPDLDQAVVPEEKIRFYLLSTSHPDGRSKAAFFFRFGFSVEKWEELRVALLEHAAEHEVSGEEGSAFGVRYVVEGELWTPSGRRPVVRSVWFVASGETAPRLVTAYPLQRRY